MALGYQISGIKAVAAGNNNTFFVDSDNSLWVSGYNYYGELGLGNRDTQGSFRIVDGAGKNVKAAASGLRHTILLKEDGTIWTAGYNFNGQLGLGDTEDRNAFTRVTDAGSDISAVAAGNYHTVILKSDGSVWTTGSNVWGQLGFTGGNMRMKFTQVSDENGRPLTGVRQIAARGDITVIVNSGGVLLLAGNYTSPAANAEPDFSAPVSQEAGKSSFVALVPEQGAAAKLEDIRKVVLGYNSIYVIDSGGRLWAAGSNRYGQLSLDFDTEASPVLKLIDF
jgi:alpha-tubulin suppressor-like RCC1 family protein